MPHATLQVQLLLGPGAGRRASFTEGPVTFGRDADNALIIPEPTVSRRHGQFILLKDAWALLNQSPNGTQVGRKLVTDKPRPLRDQDTIAIAGQPVFKITLEAPAANPESPIANLKSPLPAPASSSLSSRSKLWLGIAVGVGGLLVVLAVVAPAFKEAGPAPSALAPLTDPDIRSEICKPLPPRDLNPALAQRKLKDGKDLLNAARADPSLLYPCYRDFQEALALTGSQDFAGRDDAAQLAFDEVQQRLLTAVLTTYKQANTDTSNERRVADFRRVLNLYRDQDSAIYQSASRLALEAQSRIHKTPTGLN